MFKRALVVGINDYPLGKLDAPENDALRISELLSTNADGSENFHVSMPNGSIKTDDDLEGYVKLLFSGNVDVALFYFAGHGATDAFGGYIRTPDSRGKTDGFAMDRLLRIAQASTVPYKIIILDCCYAGELGNNPGSIHPTSTIGDNMIIFSACTRRETAKELKEHGIFTNLLINALSGGAADVLGNISPGSIYGYIDKALGAWDQRPVFKANVSRFLSIRNTEPQIDLNILRRLTTYFKAPGDEFKLDRTYEFTNPEAIDEHVKIFKEFQKLEGVGLLKPTGEEHLYFAAQHEKSCHLTPVGQSYWSLVNAGRI
jgi:hypothetical protein